MNFETEKFPSHVISVIKRDFVKINIPKFVSQVKLTGSLIDMSKHTYLGKQIYLIMNHIYD